MANITLQIQVAPIERVVLAFDRIEVWRSNELDASGTPINFTEITTALTRLVLQENIALYSYTDASAPMPTSSVWYRIRYSNSQSADVSEFTPPVQGTPNPALNILPIEDLKTNILFGIDLTDDEGAPFPDSLFGFFIEAAVSQVEAEFDITLLPTVITEEAHNFYRRDWNEYVLTVLDHRPIISVERMRVVLPPNIETIDFAPESFQIDYTAGTIEVVPGSGQITLGQTGSWLPLVFNGQDYLPRAIRVDYTAGFSDRTVRGRQGIPALIKKYIAYLAAEGPLGTAGDLIVGAGIASQSISMDGLSQSVNTTSSATNSGYGARIIQYQKERKEMRKVIDQAFRGQRMVVV